MWNFCYQKHPKVRTKSSYINRCKIVKSVTFDTGAGMDKRHAAYQLRGLIHRELVKKSIIPSIGPRPRRNSISFQIYLSSYTGGYSPRCSKSVSKILSRRGRPTPVSPIANMWRHRADYIPIWSQFLVIRLRFSNKVFNDIDLIPQRVSNLIYQL